MHFGNRLKNILEENNIKQNDLAKIVGVTEATISRYINNVQMPRLELVNKISVALNVPVDYLLGNDASCDNSFIIYIKSELEKLPPVAKKDLEDYLLFLKMKYSNK